VFWVWLLVWKTSIYYFQLLFEYKLNLKYLNFYVSFGFVKTEFFLDQSKFYRSYLSDHHFSEQFVSARGKRYHKSKMYILHQTINAIFVIMFQEISSCACIGCLTRKNGRQLSCAGAYWRRFVWEGLQGQEEIYRTGSNANFLSLLYALFVILPNPTGNIKDFDIWIMKPLVKSPPYRNKSDGKFLIWYSTLRYCFMLEETLKS
jgi:hypothetical protein